jgi:hypothetical protein
MVRLRRRKRGSSAFSVIPSVREGTLLLQESTEEMRRPLEKWTACPSFQAKVIPALCWIISDWLGFQARAPQIHPIWRTKKPCTLKLA